MRRVDRIDLLHGDLAPRVVVVSWRVELFNGAGVPQLLSTAS
jgi:hypothetical protein